MKKVLSWFALVVGVGLGSLALGKVCSVWLPEGLPDYDWPTLIGPMIFASVSLLASFTAKRNRKRAGWFFLLCAPIMGFCNAYWDAIQPASTMYFKESWPGTDAIAGITLVFFIPVVVAIFAFYTRSRPLFLASICASVLLFGLTYGGVNPFSWTFIPSLAGAAAPFVVLGLFWLGTHCYGWPRVVPDRPFSLVRRISGIMLSAIFILLGMLAGAAAWEIPLSPYWGRGECYGGPRLVEHRGATQVVFTAKVLYVGDYFGPPVRGRGSWALVSVQEHFWGLPWWFPKYLILAQGIFEKGEVCLVDNDRTAGVVTQYLPLIKSEPCRIPLPLEIAQVPLRVLQDGPAKTGVRIIGRVQYYSRLGEDSKGWPAGINMVIQGPSRTINTGTDKDGIYDVKSLPPGQYEVRPELDEKLYYICGCGTSPKRENGTVWECKYEIFSTGKPK